MSSIGSYSSNSIYSQSPYSSQSSRQQRKQDFQALATALNSNDLSSAQQAFAALQQDSPQLNNLLQNGSTSSSNSSNPIATDFQNLSQALSSNDLTSAQSAFAKLQQDLQAFGFGHHHHHGGGSASLLNSTTPPLSNATTDSDGDQDGSGSSKGINVQA